MGDATPTTGLTVIIGVLNWGIGHATRMQPVIDYLVQGGHRVILASDGVALKVLQHHNPTLPVHALPGYGIRYPRHLPAWLGTLLHLRRMRSAIKAEEAWLQAFVRSHRVDLVLSDHRYGFGSRDIPGYFITHQLQPALPGGLSWTRPWVAKPLRQGLKKFRGIGIVDHPDWPLAASLSAPSPTVFQGSVDYLGWLSALRQSPIDPSKKFSLLIILSGPEPMRSYFETLVLSQVHALPPDTVIVGGRPGRQGVQHSGYRPFADRQTMQHLFLHADKVIARGGYSTIMDILFFRQKALLVPTPGQPEQQMLARQLVDRQWMLAMPQQGLDLSRAIAALDEFSPAWPPGLQVGLRQQVLNQWLRSCSQIG